MQQPSDAWRELEDVVRFGELHELAPEVDRLGPALSLARDELEGLRQLDDEELASRLRGLLRQRQAEGRARRLGLDRQRALEAARRLQQDAVIEGDRVHLDVAVLLGDLLREPEARFIGLASPLTEPMYFARKQLRGAARALRRFDDVRAWIDLTGLHIRWRGGRGGLDLRSRTLSWAERQSVLMLALKPPLPARAVASPPPTRTLPSARSGAWLGDILVELGFLA